MKTALQSYRLDNYTYPTTEQGLQALVTKPTTEPCRANGVLKVIWRSYPWTLGIDLMCTPCPARATLWT